jgi:hypothetical protein
MRTRPVNAQHDKLIELLHEAGYRLNWCQSVLNECQKYDFCTMECWTGPRGILMVQVWPLTGVEVYHTAGVPSTWDEVAPWLRGA